MHPLNYVILKKTAGQHRLPDQFICFFRQLASLLLALVCLLFGGLFAQDPISVYLTWQNDPVTTMTIQWLTPFDTDLESIEYRLKDEENWKRASGSHSQMPEKYPYLIHRSELTQLLPDSAYEFRLHEKGPLYKFRTLPATTEKPIRFIVGGDMYQGDLQAFHTTNLQAAKLDPLFVLVGGDIAYSGAGFRFLSENGERWIEWLATWTKDMVTSDGYMIPIVPAIGNHETNGRFEQSPEQALFFYALFPMPGTQGYNVLDFGDYLSLFILDSGHTHPIPGPQAEWLLQNLKERQEIPHKFALYHVPAYPSYGDYKNKYSSLIRRHWVPKFDFFGLHAAFEHHAHTYKRSYPLKGNKVVENGVLYLGDGAWGVKKTRAAKSTKRTWYLAKSASKRHFILVTIQGISRQFEAVDAKGNVFDRFVQ